jgi:hypothetical protein
MSSAILCITTTVLISGKRLPIMNLITNYELRKFVRYKALSRGG